MIRLARRAAAAQKSTGSSERTPEHGRDLPLTPGALRPLKRTSSKITGSGSDYRGLARDEVVVSLKRAARHLRVSRWKVKNFCQLCGKPRPDALNLAGSGELVTVRALRCTDVAAITYESTNATTQASSTAPIVAARGAGERHDLA